MTNKLRDKQLFLLDMDGTIYHEDELIDGALDFFCLLQNRGINYVFMTNNSSKNANTYVEKLARLGIPATTKNIASSVDATILFLKENNPNAKLYVVGTESFQKEILDNGFEITPVDYRKNDVDYVVLGFDTELNYQKIVGACYYISRDFPYIATNCDLRCPIKDNKYIPDCGAIAKFIFEATNRMPIFLGKPERTIVDVVSKRYGIDYDKIVCVGDRLYTDIAVGINAGVDTVCVLTGEATKKDIVTTPFKPTYVFDTIKDLYKSIK